MMVFAVSWYEPELPGGLHDWLASNTSFGSPANLRLGAATALPMTQMCKFNLSCYLTYC